MRNFTKLSAFAWCTLLGAANVGCSKTEQPAEKKAQPAKAAAQATAPAATAPKVSVPSPPKSLGAPKIPADNPLTAAKVALGQKLFFDKRLSVDGSRSCYSCHQNEDGTGGHEPKAIGAADKQLTRHAPVMWNVAYLPRLYSDGRADSLEAQAIGAWAGGNMGVGKDNLAAKADELYALPEYSALFDAAFPGQGGTSKTVSQALASYERTLFCGDTAFDKFAAGDQSALTAEQKAGWDAFTGKGNCHSCHTPPFFSDAYMAEQGAYHNVGTAFMDPKNKDVDPGRQAISKSDSDLGAFKTPSLRNVTKSPPYFHDGSVADLNQAVEFMAKGGHKNPNLDPKLTDRKLTKEELASIVAFLGALECDGKLEPPPQ
jgi:cytochrome c peroxidase